jgi:hypothetical protein
MLAEPCCFISNNAPLLHWLWEHRSLHIQWAPAGHGELLGGGYGPVHALVGEKTTALLQHYPHTYAAALPCAAKELECGELHPHTRTTWFRSVWTCCSRPSLPHLLLGRTKVMPACPHHSVLVTSLCMCSRCAAISADPAAGTGSAESCGVLVYSSAQGQDPTREGPLPRGHAFLVTPLACP